jgi:hypothetical protein
MPQARSRLERSPGPPDFIGVGAEGAARDWWHGALIAHPEIDGPRQPLHFFDAFCEREMEDADVGRYHAHFQRATGAISGEWTDSYMCDGWVPALLRRAAPDAKLLVMLADPIEHYRAVFAERKAAQVGRRRVLMTDVVDRASHAFQLARLGRYYPGDRILVLQQERCRSAPLEQYRRTLRFLGVRDDRVPRGVSRALSRTDARSLLDRLRSVRRGRRRQAARLWPDLEAALHAALDPEVERLATMLPDFEPALWPNFAHFAPRVTAPRISGAR